MDPNFLAGRLDRQGSTENLCNFSKYPTFEYGF